jgi:hypothetical protein
MTFQEVYEWLNKNGVLKKFVYLDEEILIALDGTEYFSSKKISCPHCNFRNHLIKILGQEITLKERILKQYYHRSLNMYEVRKGYPLRTSHILLILVL